jgi:hypothetical protein
MSLVPRRNAVQINDEETTVTDTPMYLNVFYFFRGLSRISRKAIFALLVNNFNVISVALVVLAFWRPLQAVELFVLLFVISLVTAPFRFKNLFTFAGLWNWFRFLVANPEE